ncbi:MAG: guanylate kinase [Candidatus Competibacterales bacterium]|nr:guanylate kinase [Candidatus Competibacterales bacterium]
MSIVPGALYVIAAPSGAGKTSLVHRLLETTPDITVSVSHTTRGPRPGEENGRDYHFVDTATFERLIGQDAFLEHAQVFDHYYGTGRAAVEEQLTAGLDVILEIDWQGARQVRSRFPDCRSVFILPPSLAELRQRLCRRGQDAPAVIERRLREAAIEMSHHAEFDYLVVNDRFETSLADLRAVFLANRLRQPLQARRHEALLRELLS